MQTEKPKIAAFDVDGTLTFTDSFLLFLRFVSGRWFFLLNMIKLLPVFLVYGVRLISRDEAKNRILSVFLKNMPQEKYLRKCQEFAQIAYPIIARADGLSCLKSHQGIGDVVVFVSASLEDYLIPWAHSLGVKHVIATKMEVKNGKLTGKMAGANCRAQEKVNRIRAIFGDAEIVAAYGDSRGDKEMLAASHTPYYRKLVDEPAEANRIKRALYWGNLLV
ncbi:MAG: cicA [Hyphomonadaceae bacterium]|nr:MAG: cicA [Hyphomonadaceae bacterium]